MYSDCENIIVFGTSYFPDYDNTSTKTNVFKAEEINDSLAIKTRGLNVYLNHDTDWGSIGVVGDSCVNEKRELLSWLLISGNRGVNEVLCSGALDIDPTTNARYYKGLSMGTSVQLDMTSKNYVFPINVTPKEISIVNEYDRPNCIIHNWYKVPSNQEPREFLNDLTRKYDRFF